MIFGLSMEPAKRQGRPHQDAPTDRSIPTAEVSRAPPRDNAKGRCKTDQDVIDHLLAATVDPEVPLHFGDTWGEVPQSGMRRLCPAGRRQRCRVPSRVGRAGSGWWTVLTVPDHLHRRPHLGGCLVVECATCLTVAQTRPPLTANARSVGRPIAGRWGSGRLRTYCDERQRVLPNG
jgi:hypothetical protein